MLLGERERGRVAGRTSSCSMRSRLPLRYVTIVPENQYYSSYSM